MKKITSILFIVALACKAIAQNELKTTHINLFKNGNYYVVKEGKVNTENGYWKLPLNNFNPLLSTFWVSSTNENRLNRIEVKEDILKRTYPIQSFDEALSYNKGKKIKLTYLPSLAYTHTNSIEGILENYSAPVKVAKIKTGAGEHIFVQAQNIIELAFSETPKESFEIDSVAIVAKFKFEKSMANTPIKLSYMQSGISWSPGYNIRLVDDKKLYLQMNVVILNQSEDIVDADVTMTLGGSTFKYGNQIDPITIQALTSLASSNISYRWDNQLYSNMNMSSTYGNAPTLTNKGAYEEFDQYATTGEKSEDIFRYKLGRLTLPKDTRISSQIFGQEIPYEDVYEANIPDVINFYNRHTCYNEDEKKFDVFHSLKLHNNTSFPFTTGPVFVQDNKLQPMAQDQIKYTAVGGTVKIQLAKAVDISVVNNEKETSNKGGTKHYDGHTYYQTEIAGEILVENMQNKAIKLNLTKSIFGSIEKASDSGVIEKTGRYNQLNPNSLTEWTVELKPNERKTITYTYFVYYR